MPRRAAAPSRPKTLPPVWARAVPMLSRSRCLTPHRVSNGTSGVGWVIGDGVRGAGASKISGPFWASITARSTAF